MSKQKVLVVLVFTALFMVMCTTPNDEVEEHEVVDVIRTLGIWQTGPSGMDYGVWGDRPADDQDYGEVEEPYIGEGIVPTYKLQMSPPYPNPTNLSVTIAYTTGIDLHTVRIWAIKTLGPDEEIIAGSDPNPFIKTIFEDSSLSAGSYQRVWDLSDESGNRIPLGFYRIYLDLNGYELWRDIAVTEDGRLLE